MIPGVVELHTDSSPSKSFASRRGLGQLHHIDIKDLWLQEAVTQGRVRLRKVGGDCNLADLLTKYFVLSWIMLLSARFGVEIGIRPGGLADAEGGCW
jgi:hypothetical protein